ncbi:MAG: hypothetical protein COT71_02815 [Candidatus Andersenbacteria bacterium CG10_big_fil_rev_8_21_14_0_10_54_11]|uniref:Uncharacterized protein n=1 Tax=Candidatus Andersenbacteria bacterium CG10_big_fil_rev_8_21_14_0_10_54_11 TaxID=1974485 RepID=A0A2M6WZ61_9BACT|nr:MAG: hypothetical protein COT71_02815 [Candidatus Andersenbacteria bacterium CG10_big_fil_rev_8_21_14_0_10_54_11]
MPTYQEVISFFLKLEGPYRWYVLGAVLVLLTAIMTRIIFKTFKWFTLIAAAGVLVTAGAYYLGPLIADWLIQRAGGR